MTVFKKEAPSFGHLENYYIPTNIAKKIIKEYGQHNRGGLYNFKDYGSFISIGYNLSIDINDKYNIDQYK